MKNFFAICFLIALPPNLYAQELKPQNQPPVVELEVEFFHDCALGEEGLACKVPEDTPIPLTLKSLEQFKKPVSVGWIPALGVFVVVDSDSVRTEPVEESTGKAVSTTATLPAPKPVLFYKLNADKTVFVQTDVQTEIKNVRSQVITTTPSQMNFQVQYQLGQNAEQNKKDSNFAAIIGQQPPPSAYAQGSDTLANNPPPPATTTNAPSPIRVGYDYDAVNRLVGRQTQDGAETATTAWAYFSLMRTVEYNRGGVLDQLEFFHGAHGIDYLIPKSAKDQAGQVPAAKGLALHKDTLGSPAVVTSEETGDVAEKNFFSPFGDTTIRNNGVDYPVSKLGNPILYTGQYYDATAGLYLFPYRAYDPKMGRFLQRDPAGFLDGVNVYVYVHNSPYTLVDPLGLEGESPLTKVFIVVAERNHSDPRMMAAAQTYADWVSTRLSSTAEMQPAIEVFSQGQQLLDLINGPIAATPGNSILIVVSHAESAEDYFTAGNRTGPQGIIFNTNQGFYTTSSYYNATEGAAFIKQVQPGALDRCYVVLSGCNSAKEVQNSPMGVLGKFMEAGARGGFGNLDYAQFSHPNGMRMTDANSSLSDIGLNATLLASSAIDVTRSRKGIFHTQTYEPHVWDQIGLLPKMLPDLLDTFVTQHMPGEDPRLAFFKNAVREAAQALPPKPAAGKNPEDQKKK